MRRSSHLERTTQSVILTKWWSCLCVRGVVHGVKMLVTTSVNALSLSNANISVAMTILPDMCIGYFVAMSH